VAVVLLDLEVQMEIQVQIQFFQQSHQQVAVEVDVLQEHLLQDFQADQEVGQDQFRHILMVRLVEQEILLQ
jgi:hypothetical protein